MDASVIFNTSVFSGFDNTLTSFLLPLQEFWILPVNNIVDVTIDVFRKVCSILSPGPME